MTDPFEDAARALDSAATLLTTTAARLRGHWSTSPAAPSSSAPAATPTYLTTFPPPAAGHPAAGIVPWSDSWQSTPDGHGPIWLPGGGIVLALPASGGKPAGNAAPIDPSRQRFEVYLAPDPHGNPTTWGPNDSVAFALDVRLDPSFPIDTDRWQTLSQWKNDGTGSPPVELMVGHGQFYLQGHDAHGAETWRLDLGPATRDVVHRILVALVFNETHGGVVAQLDGRAATGTGGRTAPTLYPGQRCYWKAGIYRDAAIAQPGTATFTRAAYGPTIACVA